MAVIGATAGAEMEAQISKLTVQKDTPSTTCVFLSIARELRDMIYGHLLEITPAEHCYPDGPAKRYSLPSLAILATNKQIRDEAQVVYDKVNEIVSIETSIEIATMDEPRPIGFLNTRIGQAAEDSARRFKRLAELLDEAHLPRLKIMSTSASSAGHEKKPSNFLLMLEDLPDLMLGLYLYEVMDEMNVRDKASIQELEFKWELPQGTKARRSMSLCKYVHCADIFWQ